MFHFSRSLYRELARDIDKSRRDGRLPQREVLEACEATMHRLVTDRRYFARPARRLFDDIRHCFPLAAQERVWHVVRVYVSEVEAYLDAVPHDASGQPAECPVTTRRGTPCRREPLANGYCPSHQHLVGTAGCDLVAA